METEEVRMTATSFSILLEIRAKIIIIIVFLLLNNNKNNNNMKSRVIVVLCRMYPGVKEPKNTLVRAPWRQ